jgi:hypothetical protein
MNTSQRFTLWANGTILALGTVPYVARFPERLPRVVGSWFLDGGIYVRLFCWNVWALHLGSELQIKNRAPLVVAIVLLVLPVLYVGSYLAMVVPGGTVVEILAPHGPAGPFIPILGSYRFANDTASKVFWPLEQIDRKLRPGAWRPIVEFRGGLF